MRRTPAGVSSFPLSPHTRLHVNFDEAKLVLDETIVRGVYDVLVLFMREAERLQAFLNSYALALTLFQQNRHSPADRGERL